jgi:hypothetical protein
MRLGVVLMVLWLAAATSAQETPQRQTANTLTAAATVPSAAATLADFRWLEGNWTGQGLGGVCDESWSTPAGGAMMGMFRLRRGDAVVFYEFLTLVEQAGSVVLKLKHFNPDLTGWEEKTGMVTFRLLRLSPDAANFGGLTFKKVGSDRMQIFLALRDKDGSVREEEFRYERLRD